MSFPHSGPRPVPSGDTALAAIALVRAVAQNDPEATSALLADDPAGTAYALAYLICCQRIGGDTWDHLHDTRGRIVSAYENGDES